MEALQQVNGRIYKEFAARRRAGANYIELIGGRRSGKTYFLCQFLMTQVLRHGDVVNVATMTAEQGRLGAYADFVTLINGTPSAALWLEVLSSPREVRCSYNAGRVFFNSYQNSERAKGVACDWLFVNECNNFTYQQFIDLAANARKGVVVDHNPTKEHFWVDQVFKPEDVLHSTWQDNEYLPETQKRYFADLRSRRFAPNATSMDRYLYDIYYLGQYSDAVGDIFTPANLRSANEVPQGLRHWTIFCDPSALRGADYFACVLAATDGYDVYFVDGYSVNIGGREYVVAKLLEWLRSYDIEHLYVETNGYVGLDFYDFAVNSELPVEVWNSKGNKFERIVANYQNLTTRARFALPAEYMQQVYIFGERCEHDDNIDAINSAFASFVFDGYIKV